MKFSIELPFSEIVFNNAQKKHKEYFKSLFFTSGKIHAELKYKITVNFRKISLVTDKRLYLEEDTIAWDGNLYILDTKGNKLKLDFDLSENDNFVLSVEPGFDLYFLYNFIIEPLLIIWAAGYYVLYIHSSALWKNGQGYIFPAWRHTGKTSSIFSLTGEKIKFMGDDFCVLYDSKVYLYPKNINIFSYNFETYPWLYSRLPHMLALRIKLSVYLKKLLFWISQRLSGSLSKVFYRLSELTEISTNTKVTPRQLGMSTQTVAPFAKAFFVTKADIRSKKAKKLDLQAIKQKLLSITVYEIGDFLAIYQKYKYLYPENRHEIIDSFEANYLKAVEKNLKEAYETKITSLLNKDAYIDNDFFED